MNKFIVESKWTLIEVSYNQSDQVERIELVPKSSKVRGKAPVRLQGLEDQLKQHLRGEKAQYKLNDFNLDKLGSFQRRVLEATFQIPFSETLSYSELAEKIGSPGASRAVGTALGKNPFPLAIPCHRILKKNGELGHFSALGGTQTKRRLLELEKVRLTKSLPSHIGYDRNQ